MTQAEYWGAAEDINSIRFRACPAPHELVRGAIIGVVDVVEIVSASASPWFFGPRGLVLRNTEPCEPIPCSGALGYFQWKQSGAIEAPLKWMLPENDVAVQAPAKAAAPAVPDLFGGER
jgi:hypothetical protein